MKDVAIRPKKFRNDGRAPDTAEALRKTDRKSKRHLESEDEMESIDTDIPVPGKQSSHSKRPRAPVQAVPEETESFDIDVDSAESSDSSNEKDPISATADRAAMAISDADRTTGIIIDGTVRQLRKPSGNVYCYVGYEWENNSCAYDTSLELLFIIVNSDIVSTLRTELLTPSAMEEVSGGTQTVSLASIFRILHRRMLLYDLMPPAELRTSINISRTMIQQITLGISDDELASAPYTSTLVR